MPMALVLCPECQKEVSTHAVACPQCGFPSPGTTQGPSANHTDQSPALVVGNDTKEETWLCTHCGTPYTRKIRRSEPSLNLAPPVSVQESYPEGLEKEQSLTNGHDKMDSSSRTRHPLPLWQDSQSYIEPLPPRFPRNNRRSLLVGGFVVLLLTISIAFGVLWHLKGINPLDLIALLQNLT